MPKSDQLAGLLKTRIVQGDYALRGLPAERQLAQDSGVSLMTARRALQLLIDDGLLARGSNGRVEVVRTKSAGRPALHVAFLAPSFPSASIDRWRRMITQAVEAIDGAMRPVLYVHWDDPLINETLEGFDGTFLMPSTEPMSAATINRFRESGRPVVVLNEDMSQHGLPSIRQSSPVFVQSLLDHLEVQGYRNIDCLNVQPVTTIVEQRIQQWQLWMMAHRCPGVLINEPVASYGEPVNQAYNVVRERITLGDFRCEALLCITLGSAVGAMRAMYEAGIAPGRDVAVCVVGGEGQAAFQIPSLTALEAPDVTPFISHCLQWMLAGGDMWSGPLLMQPLEPLMVVRESTSTPHAKSRPFVSNPAAQSAAQENNHAKYLSICPA